MTDRNNHNKFSN